jgi:acyl carrier protein
MNPLSWDKIFSMSDEVIKRVSEYISREILKDPTRQILADQPIISSGLIDSFGLVDLALFVEDAFGVRIEDIELTSSVFDTVAELAQLISSRLPDSTP